MQISLALNTADRKDLQLASDTLSYMLGFVPYGSAAPTAVANTVIKAAPQLAANEIKVETGTQAPTPPTEAMAANPPQVDVPKAVKAAKKKVAEVATPVIGVLDFTAIKQRLQAYSEDARFGMNGVLVLLNKYGVQRVSALPEAQYEAFAQEIDEALAAKSDPLA